MAQSRAGQILAKGLFIDLNYRHEQHPSASASDSSSIQTYEEEEPTTAEWLASIRPTGAGIKRYIASLFPFWSWIFHYNVKWLLGDIIAGVTVGFVVVPQGMAYALLAKLPAEYGLYTSFMGFLLYWAFATSKDITIGTVAVMSTLVGNIIIKVQKHHPEFTAPEIASALAVISGSVLLFIGLVRLGWIVELIPLVAITSFMTGAAISIAVGQVPTLLGLKGINTREASYKVFINTLKGLPTGGLDAAMGLSALFLLYLIRAVCTIMGNKQPHRRKFWFFVSTLRMAFVILLYILISWAVNRNVKVASKAKFKVLGTVPRGFKHAGAPVITTDLISAIAPDLPSTIIVLIIEHIAISKSFGRINNYVINPSQELVAVGFTNVLGPFLGAYPATGSFSRTAIKSKAGVRTPLAGIFTAVIVLLALYALTSVFFYIPMAALAGLIIHAVGDLITPPDVVYKYWQTSPLEVFIFFAGVLLTLFTNIENGIYLTMAASAALLAIRIARAKGDFLAKTTVYDDTRDGIQRKVEGSGAAPSADAHIREIYVPQKRKDGSNTAVDIKSPYPGVFIYRFSEGFNYLNAAHYMDKFTAHIFKETRRTVLDQFASIGDRPWNDPGPRRGQKIDVNDDRPILRAVILDFSSVTHVDVTSVQALADVRYQLSRYAVPEVVEWHFASVTNRWTKRALASAGFGYIHTDEKLPKTWTPFHSFAPIAAGGEVKNSPRTKSDEEHTSEDDITTTRYGDEKNVAAVSYGSKFTTLYGANRPFFHADVPAAVAAAVLSAEAKAQAPEKWSNVESQ